MRAASSLVCPWFRMWVGDKDGNDVSCSRPVAGVTCIPYNPYSHIALYRVLFQLLAECVAFIVCVKAPSETSISRTVIPRSDVSADPPGHMYRISAILMYVKM